MNRAAVDAFIGLGQWGSSDFQNDPLFSDKPGNIQCYWMINSRSRSGVGKSRGNWDVFIWGSIRDITRNGIETPVESILDSLNSGQSLVKILQEKEGEFIIVAWDKVKRAAHLAADPLGHMKLYYFIAGHGIYFSSHSRLLSPYGPGDKISKEGLELLLSLRVTPSPFTVIDQVYKVQPGTILSVADGRKEVIEYYSLTSESQKYNDFTFDEAKDLLLEKLTLSITRSLANSVPPNGLFLSGGLDSGLILALSKRQGISLENFTVGYSDRYVNDESNTALLTAQAFNAPISVCKENSRDIGELIIQKATFLPEPVGDISFYSQLLLAQQASDRVDVILDGSGADNLYGGLQKAKAETYIPQYFMIPSPIRNHLLPSLINLFPSSRKTRLTSMIRKAKRFIEGSKMPYMERQIYWARLMHKSVIKAILKPEYQVERDVCNEVLEEAYNSAYSDRGLLSSSCMSVKCVLPWASLLKLSAIEYLTGMSVRLPFLAPDFVQFSLGIPDQYKVMGHSVKHILRKSAEAIEPNRLRNRNPGNFTPPMRLWIKGDLKELFLTTLAQTGPFDQNMIQAMVRDQFTDNDDWLLELWVIFMFQSWMKSSATNDLTERFHALGSKQMDSNQ